MAKPYERCYPAGNHGILALFGYALLIAGVILLFCCIPGWAWLALLGVGLMAFGALLLKFSRAWR